MTGSRPVALTQRPTTSGDELRLTLDVRWNRFLAACGLVAVPLPLEAAQAERTIEVTGCVGIILTGGDDLSGLGGATPERDTLERELVQYSVSASLPVLGVCRGMQILLASYGARPTPVAGHAGVRHRISGDQLDREVNSYHRWGLREVPDCFAAQAHAYTDQVVEAVRHRRLPQTGIMWHPERNEPFDDEDVDLAVTMFGPPR